MSPTLTTWLVAHLVTGGPAEIQPRAAQIVEQMFTAWDNVQTITFRMKKQERLTSGEVTSEEVRVKLRKPSDVYLYNVQPHPGQEVIYSPSRNKKELTAHRGSFPDVTVDLSIYGGMATNGQHHPIIHTGFGYLCRLIHTGIKGARRNPNGERLTDGGTVTIHGRTADRVVLHAGTRPHVEVKAEKGESVFRFAARHDVDPYVLVYNNPSLDDLSDSVSAGETYVFPAYYAKKTEVFVDRLTHLPLKTVISDFEGHVYEQFEYFDVVVNPALTDADFDPENPDYGF